MTLATPDTRDSKRKTMATQQQAAASDVNLAQAIDMVAMRRVEDSTYSGIVRLVQAAQAAKAPMVRLAGRRIAFGTGRVGHRRGCQSDLAKAPRCGSDIV